MTLCHWPLNSTDLNCSLTPTPTPTPTKKYCPPLALRVSHPGIQPTSERTQYFQIPNSRSSTWDSQPGTENAFFDLYRVASTMPRGYCIVKCLASQNLHVDVQPCRVGNPTPVWLQGQLYGNKRCPRCPMATARVSGVLCLSRRQRPNAYLLFYHGHYNVNTGY